MTQPTAYVPQHDYSQELGTAHGTHLDEDFADIRQTTDEIRANLGLLQRDDGRVKNRIVHADAFDASALALIAGDWKPKGNWATATSYTVGDVVEQGGSGYVCASAHISGVFATDHTAGKWVLFANDQALRTDLAASTGSSLVGFIHSFPGAKKRALDERGREYISALDAMTEAEKADVVSHTGSTDVSAAVQVALDALVDGMAVEFPGGVWNSVCEAGSRLFHGGGRRLRRTTDAVGKSAVKHLTLALG